jgi:exodeoxyribonuclease VII large subunit
MKREMRYHLLRLRQELTEWMAHRGFQDLRAVVAQMAQRTDETGARLLEAGRNMLRLSRRRWEIPQSFLQHFDLRGRQERARMNWSRQNTALGHGMHLLLMGKRGFMEPVVAKLENLSPRRVLERGYAIVFDGAGKVLRSAAEISPGQPVIAQLARGRLKARVEEAIPEAKKSE